MPLYYDATAIRKRVTGHHLELACDFLESVCRKQDYFQRGFDTPINELAIDDLTDEVVASWVIVRRWLAKTQPHIFFKHPHALMNEDHTAKGVTSGHGHGSPPLFILFEGVTSIQTDSLEMERARRDLMALAGLKTSASRAKDANPFKPES